MSLFNWFGGKKDREPRTLEAELTELYRSHSGTVYAYFYRVTGSREESEELTQETFYQAVRSIHRFQGRSSLKTWLLQIARNIYRNKVRDWVKEKQYRSEAGDWMEVSDDTYSPERNVMEKHSREELALLLLQLPVDYREVLVLKELEGLSHADIARIVDKTPQTTKVLLYRAKAKLRELYQREVLSNEEPL